MSRSTVVMVVLLAGLSIQAGAQSADQSLAQLQSLSDGFVAVAAKVEPSVVAIVSRATVTTGPAQNPFQGTPFEDFFDFRIPEQEIPRQGQGSGVIVMSGGEYYILTNNHMVRGADEIQVELEDKRTFKAQVVGTDSLSDVAVLKIQARGLPAIAWGNSDELKVGQWVVAVGNPFGYEHTVTSGIVSALGRQRFGAEYGSFIQTDAAINPGNSGGALVNLRGELVGINTAIVSRTGGNLGIGFAIPVNLARSVLEQIVEHGEVRRGLLGVEIKDLDPEMAEGLGMENTRGVLIDEVVAGGPAEKAGVEKGDVVLAIDGTPVKNTVELRSRIGETPPGTRVELRLLRNKREMSVDVVLGKLTAEALARGGGQGPGGRSSQEGKLGLAVQDLTPELAEHLRFEGEKGVVISGVRRGSEAMRKGIRPGDLIQELNREPVESVEQYEAALARVKPGQAVLLLVRRGDSTNFVGLRMPE